MKLLYAIQGTGYGHISRARDIVPLLEKKADVDILISGRNRNADFPYDVTYSPKGMSFVNGRTGSLDIYRTIKQLDLLNFVKEIRSFPAKKYDLVISDFEPVSAWSARINKVPCIGLSHQAAVINRYAPKPTESDLIGESVLKYYAPAKYQYGFHFVKYDRNIFTPVIRKEIREAEPKASGHYTVYLPAYSDEFLISHLSRFADVSWEIFSNHARGHFRFGNINVHPVQNEDFILSMAGCEGMLCGAGFETPAECLYLGKKLMVIPMKGQYEQQCNAVALSKLGIPVLHNFDEEGLGQIESWLNCPRKFPVIYPDNTESIIDMILSKHCGKQPE